MQFLGCESFWSPVAFQKAKRRPGSKTPNQDLGIQGLGFGDLRI